jgi:hypothetical protein
VQEATFPLRARKPRQSADFPTQRPVVGSQSLQLRSCFLTVRDPQHTHTHTQARTCMCPASDAHLHGHRALSCLVLKTRQQKHPSVIRLLCRPSPSATPVTQRLPNLACEDTDKTQRLPTRAPLV